MFLPLNAAEQDSVRESRNIFPNKIPMILINSQGLGVVTGVAGGIATGIVGGIVTGGIGFLVGGVITTSFLFWQKRQYVNGDTLLQQNQNNVIADDAQNLPPPIQNMIVNVISNISEHVEAITIQTDEQRYRMVSNEQILRVLSSHSNTSRPRLYNPTLFQDQDDVSSDDHELIAIGLLRGHPLETLRQ